MKHKGDLQCVHRRACYRNKHSACGCRAVLLYTWCGVPKMLEICMFLLDRGTKSEVTGTPGLTSEKQGVWTRYNLTAPRGVRFLHPGSPLTRTGTGAGRKLLLTTLHFKSPLSARSYLKLLPVADLREESEQVQVKVANQVL